VSDAVIGAVIGALIGDRCAVCTEVGPSPCPTCAASLRPGGFVRPCPVGLDRCVAVYVYEGAARRLVTAGKFRNHRSALGMLAAAAAGKVDAAEVDLVAWPPTTAAHRRHRGFDHGELLARAVARHLDRPAVPLLRRRGGPAQTGQDAAHRRRGPDLVARPVARRRVRGARLLLVDDVVTTGATLRCAATVLRAAGATSVHAVVLARTPAPRHPGCISRRLHLP
jgi:predicted amidophosphoribosyltransferase